MPIPYEALARGGRNAGKVVKEKYLKKYLENPNICEYCGKAIVPREGERLQDVKKRKFCNRQCRGKYRTSRTLKKEKKPKAIKESKTPNKTKGELFSGRANWQSARSSIRDLARKEYISSGKPMECFVCGYTCHVQVCHKKAVSDFDDKALVKEINDIENLVPLCPNHHWEFDNKILKL